MVHCNEQLDSNLCNAYMMFKNKLHVSASKTILITRYGLNIMFVCPFEHLRYKSTRCKYVLLQGAHNELKKKLFIGTISCTHDSNSLNVLYISFAESPSQSAKTFLTMAFVVLCCLKLRALKEKVEALPAQHVVYHILAHTHLE